jgi:Zn-dependent M28 family amino/carboxypeptidase
VLRIVCCALLLAVVSAGQGTAIHYDTVPAEDINRRLGDFKDSNSAREQELHALFEEVGCSGEHLKEQNVKHSKDPNVICVLPGQSESTIIIGAHFDFVNKGAGVVDNWSGCSLLPSFYQSLKAFPRRHRFLFIGFTDEEKGLVGSDFYVHQMSKEDVRGISAMVNMDSLGTTPTKVDLDRGDKQLANTLATVAGSMHLPLSVMNVGQAGRSDGDSFRDRHVRSITIHSMTNETWPILHSARDQITEIRLADYYDTYRLIAAYLAYLDVTMDASGAAGN